MARFKKGESDKFKMSDEQADALLKEGAAPGLTKGQARFNALMGRIVGRKHGPAPSEDTKQFLINYDRHMRELTKANGLELREDHDEPSM